MDSSSFAGKIDFQVLFENNTDGILIHDLSTNLIVSANQRSLDVLDRAKEDILNKSPFTFHAASQLEDEAYMEKLNRVVEETKKNGKSKAKRIHFRQNGEKTWLQVNTYLMPPPHDNLMVIVHQDITELEQQQVMIAQQNKELLAKNKELEAYIKSNSLLENFAFTAAHDLQSPINTMVSFSKFLKVSLEEKDYEEAMEYTEFINEAAKNLKALVKDLLAYSRAKSAQYNPETFDLNNLIERLIKELDFSIKKSKATIELVNLPEDFIGDKIRIRQLLQNLISNGIKFKAPDRAPIVQIKCKTLDDCWLFEVSDNGIGIEEKDYDEIFKLFRRLHHKKAFSGTGIGLALCQNIIEQHKGRIWLKSEIGKGTTFHFSIPKPD